MSALWTLQSWTQPGSTRGKAAPCWLSSRHRSRNARCELHAVSQTAGCFRLFAPAHLEVGVLQEHVLPRVQVLCRLQPHHDLQAGFRTTISLARACGRLPESRQGRRAPGAGAQRCGAQKQHTSAMWAMRSCVSGRRYRKRPAVSSSAATASTLCPLKSSSRICEFGHGIGENVGQEFKARYQGAPGTANAAVACLGISVRSSHNYWRIAAGSLSTR